MDAAAFSRSPSGYLVDTVLGQKAFVPNPLPPENLDLSKCFESIDLASRAMSELKGMSYKVNNPLNLINPLQKREAISSSSIEGTYTTANDLLLLEADPRGSHSDPDTREVYNYIDALTEGMQLLESLPVSGRLIKRIHEILLSGVKRQRGAEIVPGEYKTNQNFIGSRARQISDARFVPPPPSMTDELMSELERYINERVDSKSPPVIVNALIHYQFETIHPFPDGNGRIGRLLLPIVLKNFDQMPMPLLYISPFIEKHKDEYNDLMLAVSRDGAWEDWICFFALAIEDSARETMEKINKIAELKNTAQEKIQQARASALLYKLIDFVFDRLIVSIPQVARELDVTYAAARNNIDRIVEIGYLSEVIGQRRPKLYLCRPLFSIVFDKDSQTS